MAASLRKARKLPVLVILGATGSGKSKLAIDIASKFDGEIISTDSMQVYKGLDIVTNKVTPQEQSQCQHHMIAYLDPLHGQHTVTDFRNRALPIINNILEQQKLPIIVGGTNYYIESLLWKFLIDKQSLEKDEDSFQTSSNDSHDKGLCDSDKQAWRDIPGYNPTEEVGSCEDDPTDRYMEYDSEALHKQLMDLDAAKARTIHRNDRRKIIRALEVFRQHGVRMSDILNQQHSEAGGGHLSGPLRYLNTCILWLQCTQSVLDERCDKRVDGMLERGLLSELHSFHQQYNQERAKEDRADYTRGIFQSIGFKEFHNYLLLPEDERETEEGEKLLQEGIDALKLVTKRYARYQVKWIKNRFMKRPGDNIPPIYAVDSTNPETWVEDAYNPACSIVRAYLQGEKPAIDPLPCEGETINRVVHMTCDACDGRLFVRETEWLAHINSRKHKKRMSSLRSDLHGVMKKQKHEESAQSSVNVSDQTSGCKS